MSREEMIARRQRLGLSQEQLAAALGVGRQRVAEWECGKVRAIPEFVALWLRELELQHTMHAVTAAAPHRSTGAARYVGFGTV